jgi:hypothetical protein
MARTRTMSSPIVFSRAPVRGGAIVKHAGSARFAALKLKAKEGLKRTAGRARQVAFSQRHRIASIGVGAGLGLLRRYAPDTMDKLSYGPATPEIVIGLGALIASYFVKNEYLDHIATGALTVGAYQLASGAGVSGTGEF